jgi:hypothetical protein
VGSHSKSLPSTRVIRSESRAQAKRDERTCSTVPVVIARAEARHEV